ncbi:hypothetical protein [Rhodothalassium salexigens]|uniref:hypothetical protein n=1 Tax=Rhodothalassium salexigens TaxID=1086 RepID=UPI00104FC9E6|nr:hypothetical protein [Rhodothalassium salexigens]MBB4212089.1 hypothetical protein [Rhodothalassium salexigens DSM 2132]
MFEDVSDLNLCDGTTGSQNGILTFEIPVILTTGGTAVGNQGNASVQFALTASPTTVASTDALDDPIFEVVAPFATAFVADSDAPLLDLSADPIFSGFAGGSNGDLGVLSLDFTGTTTPVTTLGGGTTVSEPDTVELTVTLEDATGVSGITIGSGGDATALTQNGNVFSVTLDAGTNLTVAELVANSDDQAGPSVTGETITLALAGDASALEQSITASVTSQNASDETIASATLAATALAGLEREGASKGPFEWVDLAGAGANSAFRFTGLEAENPVFVTVTNTQDGQTGPTDFDITSALSNSGGQEYILTGAALGAFLADAGEITLPESGALRADVEFTIQQASGAEVRRLLFQPQGGFTDLGDENN